MTFLTKPTEKTKESYKVLYLPNSNDPQSRRKTDRCFLIAFVISIALLLPLIIYTLSYSDINRLKGCDQCGNICGQKNAKYDQWDCTGQDMTLKPIVAYDRTCLEDRVDKRAYSMMNAQDAFNIFNRNIWKVVLVSFLPLALCLILVVMFKYIPGVAVWSILVAFWLIFTFLGLVQLYISYFLWESVAVTIFCIISIVLLFSCIIVNENYIRLTAALLKEATRPLFEVKMMSFIPAGALFLLIVVLLIGTILNFHFITSGKLTELYTRKLEYVADNLMLATPILSCVLAFWAMMFVLGAQYTTLSGAVAQWYTVKNLDNLDDAVSSNIRTTINYHLGTIALGSVMMTIMFIPRSIVQFFTIFSAFKQKADSWLRYLDGFFTNNSYIITAKYGTSFIQSGKKAANLLKLSIGDTRDLNSFANSVIQIAQIIIVFISTSAISVIKEDYYIYGCYFIYIEFAVACVCAYVILGTLKVSTNTLFFCATEELLKNEETDQPYNMTMKEFVKGSNNLFLQKVQSIPPSNMPVKSVNVKMFLFIFIAITCMLLFAAYFISSFEF